MKITEYGQYVNRMDCYNNFIQICKIYICPNHFPLKRLMRHYEIKSTQYWWYIKDNYNVYCYL